MDACLNCPAVPADEGFLKEAPAGGLRSDSSGGVSVPEGPFVLPPPETGPLELKGFVSSEADLPEWPRTGWVVIADQEGVYGGVALSAGDALVCAGVNPPVWLPLGSGGDYTGPVDASRLYGTASVDTTGNAATASHAVSADLAAEASHAISADSAAYSVSAGSASEASHAVSADSALDAVHASIADEAAYSVSAGSASEASHAVSANSATEASHAGSADSATEADRAGLSDRVGHSFSISAGSLSVSFDGSADVSFGVAAGDGLSLSVSGSVAALSQAPTGVAPGSYNSVIVGADGRVASGSNPTTLGGYGIRDAYTKQEVDSRLTSGMHYRGSVPTYNDLPSQDNVAGDFYNVSDTGNNYAWDGTEWDFIGNLIIVDSISLSEIDNIAV